MGRARRVLEGMRVAYVYWYCGEPQGQQVAGYRRGWKEGMSREIVGPTCFQLLLSPGPVGTRTLAVLLFCI